jgi:hypothetical protein
MKKGDLVQVKPGCGDQGRIGILAHEAPTPFTHCLVLFPEGMREINRYWLGVLDTRASDDAGGMISASREK